MRMTGKQAVISDWTTDCVSCTTPASCAGERCAQPWPACYLMDDDDLMWRDEVGQKLHHLLVSDSVARGHCLLCKRHRFDHAQSADTRRLLLK